MLYVFLSFLISPFTPLTMDFSVLTMDFSALKMDITMELPGEGIRYRHGEGIIVLAIIRFA